MTITKEISLEEFEGGILNYEISNWIYRRCYYEGSLW